MTAPSDYPREQVQRGYRIRGVVQGVGFRWWTRRLAGELGVGGTVRNCPDGSVEVRARAPEAVVEAFARGLAEGPPMSVVDSVEAFPVVETLPDRFEVVAWS